MVEGRLSGSEWTREHLGGCYTEKDLRELLEVPAEGAFQVVFKGMMDGCESGCPWDGVEWDEWFDVEESLFAPIPAECAEARFGEPS